MQMLERNPAMVVYSEDAGIIRYVMKPMYVYSQGTTSSPSQIKSVLSARTNLRGWGVLKSSSTPLPSHGWRSDYRHWSEDEAVLNLDGFARLREKKTP